MKNPGYFVIGIFVISAVAIATVATVVLGVGALFQDKIIIETYFEESVQGLDIGSPIKFRGVQVGKVDKITFVGQVYPTEKRYILVRVALNAKYLISQFKKDAKMMRKQLNKAIKQGMRIRISYQGITGAAYLETDYFDPKQSVPLEISWKPEYFYIPSVPSTITRFSDIMERIMVRLERIDIDAISDSLERSVLALSKALEEINMKAISKQTEQLVEEVRQTNKHIQQVIDKKQVDTILADAAKATAKTRQIVEKSEQPLTKFVNELPETTEQLRSLTKSLQANTADLPEVLERLNKTLRRIDNIVSAKQQDVEVSIENFRRASENLKEVTENAKKYPSQVIFGGPPPQQQQPGGAPK